MLPSPHVEILLNATHTQTMCAMLPLPYPPLPVELWDPIQAPPPLACFSFSHHLGSNILCWLLPPLPHGCCPHPACRLTLTPSLFAGWSTASLCMGTRNPWWAIFPNSANGDVFFPLVWSLTPAPLCYSHTILVVAFLSLSSPHMDSDTLHIATVICPHPNLSLMPIWLGPNTSLLDWIVQERKGIVQEKKGIKRKYYELNRPPQPTGKSVVCIPNLQRDCMWRLGP